MAQSHLTRFHRRRAPLWRCYLWTDGQCQAECFDVTAMTVMMMITAVSSSRHRRFLYLSDALHTLRSYTFWSRLTQWCPKFLPRAGICLDRSDKRKQTGSAPRLCMNVTQMRMSEQLARSNCSTSISDWWLTPSVFGQSSFESTKRRLVDHTQWR